MVHTASPLHSFQLGPQRSRAGLASYHNPRGTPLGRPRVGSGRPATVARAWGAADSSRVSETSRGAERDRWHREALHPWGPAEVAHRAGQGETRRSSLGRSRATPLGLEVAAGTTEHWQPTPAATGVERPAQRLLPAARAGNFRQSFLPFLPRPPRNTEPHAQVQALWRHGAEMEVPMPVPVLVLRVPACAVRAPGLGGSFPPAIRQPGSPATRCRVGSCLTLPGPEARLGLSDPGVAYVSGAPGTIVASRLPENVSPAAVSKSPAKVTRQVPSVLMVPSARRAASGRRRPVASGSQGGREPKLQASRVDTTAAKHQTPKWQQLHKSEVPRLRDVGTASWILLPSLWPPLRVWRRRERERRARPGSPNPRWDPVLSPPKRCP